MVTSCWPQALDPTVVGTSRLWFSKPHPVTSPPTNHQKVHMLVMYPKTPTPHTIFIFFYFFKISWRIITLQYCSGFCHTLTWTSLGYTCIPHPDPPSHLPLHTIFKNASLKAMEEFGSLEHELPILLAWHPASKPLCCKHLLSEFSFLHLRHTSPCSVTTWQLCGH